MSNVAIVYHSGYGHTQALAEAVAKGARAVPGTKASLIPVAEAEARAAELDAADAIVFGSPTYMGGVSADFAKFKDWTSKTLDGGHVAQQARRRLHRLGLVERRQAQHALPAADARGAARHGLGRPRPAAGQQPLEGLESRTSTGSARRSARWPRPMPTRASRASPPATSRPSRRSAAASPRQPALAGRAARPRQPSAACHPESKARDLYRYGKVPSLRSRRGRPRRR